MAKKGGNLMPKGMPMNMAKGMPMGKGKPAGGSKQMKGGKMGGKKGY